MIVKITLKHRMMPQIKWQDTLPDYRNRGKEGREQVRKNGGQF